MPQSYTPEFKKKIIRLHEEEALDMKYTCTVFSVADINAARKFYEDLFGVKVYQGYGKNVAFSCGFALQ